MMLYQIDMTSFFLYKICNSYWVNIYKEKGEEAIKDTYSRDASINV